jgi:hypothetical protein
MATYGTFVDNTTLKASELNDFFPSVSVIPVVRQPGSLAITAARYGKYFVVNKTVFYVGHMILNGAGTAGQRVEVDLPVAAASSSVRVIGHGYINDFSANRIYRCSVVQFSTTRAAFLSNDATSLTAYFGTSGGPNIALASSDVVSINICYEAA